MSAPKHRDYRKLGTCPMFGLGPPATETRPLAVIAGAIALQQLLLGMNAHINGDLGAARWRGGRDAGKGVVRGQCVARWRGAGDLAGAIGANARGYPPTGRDVVEDPDVSVDTPIHARR